MNTNEFYASVKNDCTMNHDLDWYNPLDIINNKLHECFSSESQKRSDFYDLIKEFDEKTYFVLLFCQYTYQVNNGGHSQYFENGYASYDDLDKGYFGNKCTDLDVHHEMIDLFKKYFNTTDISIYNKFLQILKNFDNTISNEDCSECGGSGFYEDEDEDGNIYYDNTCMYCHGSGIDENSYRVDSDKLDDEFYNISEELIKSMSNEILNNWIIKNQVNTFKGESSVMTEHKPKIKLIGTDGNAFVIIGKCEAELRRIGKKDLIPEFRKKAMSGDYSNLLCTCMEYFEVY